VVVEALRDLHGPGEEAAVVAVEEEPCRQRLVVEVVLE
jgi:hypothetical protein